MQSVEKPIVTSLRLTLGSGGRENSLVRVALGAVRKERDDLLVGAEALRDPHRRRRSRRSTDRETFLAGDLPARVEGLLVADLEDLVHERTVEDRPDLREP